MKESATAHRDMANEPAREAADRKENYVYYVG